MSNWDFCFSAGRMKNTEILKSVLETYYLSIFLSALRLCILHLNCRSLYLRYTFQKGDSAVQLKSHVLTALRGWNLAGGQHCSDHLYLQMGSI